MRLLRKFLTQVGSKYRPDELLTPEHVTTVFEIQKKCTATPGYPEFYRRMGLETKDD